MDDYDLTEKALCLHCFAWLARRLLRRSGRGEADAGVFARPGLALRPDRLACDVAEGVFARLVPAPTTAISVAPEKVRLERLCADCALRRLRVLGH